MAVYGRAQNMPNYSADAGGNYIPELWAPNIQIRYYKQNVSKAIVNNSYEGEIKNYGDVVHVNTYPDITISNYVKGQRLAIQMPDSTPTTLTIDKGKSYNFMVDDVDEKQAKPDLVKTFTDTAGSQMSEEIDKDILQGTYSSAHADNIGATAGAESSSYDMGASTVYENVTKTNILDYIVDMGSILDEQNVPNDGSRWVVLPPWAAGLIRKSDSKRVPRSSNIAA